MGWSLGKIIAYASTTVINTRGYTAKINKPQCYIFSYRVIDRWNELPQSITDSGTINTFKNGLNKLRKNRMDFFTDQSVAGGRPGPVDCGFRRTGKSRNNKIKK